MPRRRAYGSLRLLPLAAALTILAQACGPEEHSYVPNAGAATPTMSTADVNTFISDSGYTRYFISSPLWQIYEDAPERYWHFPSGLELEQYDLQLRPASHLRCDSARYFADRHLWRLDGHVVMVNTSRDTFLTQQVFWDQTRREVYSDSFIHITRADRIIEGYGFTSNESMTQFSVNRPTGIFPAQRTVRHDSAQHDTVAAAPRVRQAAPGRVSQTEPQQPAQQSPATMAPRRPAGQQRPAPSARPAPRGL